MNEHDDHVIPYEEAVRRHRAIEEAQRREKGVIHEVKMSDAMSHLLGEEQESDEDGPSPEHLRRIVEREFTDEGGRSDGAHRPRPRLVEAPEEEPMGQVCSFETRVCEDPARTPEDPPRH
jgi:hypothetical protein